MAEARQVTLDELVAMLAVAPVMCEIDDRLSLVYLPPEVRVLHRAADMVAELNALEPQSSAPLLCPRIDWQYADRLVTVQLAHQPLDTALNEVLPTRHEEVAASMLQQSRAAEYIANRARDFRPDCVIWLIVDGLSHRDVVHHAPEWLPHVRPMFVDGVSTTSRGMRRLIGTPPVCSRLFDVGYLRAHGFTYWTRDSNALTNDLFDGFGNAVTATRTLENIVDHLRDQSLQNTFIQVIRDGVDHVAHRSHNPPTVGAIVRNCFVQLEHIADLVRAAGRSALLFLCSDHGMLWRDEHELVTLPEPGQPPPRYVDVALQSAYTITYPDAAHEGSLVRYPFIRRALKINEWGVHGGLSYEESVIPFVEISI